MLTTHSYFFVKVMCFKNGKWGWEGNPHVSMKRVGGGGGGNGCALIMLEKVTAYSENFILPFCFQFIQPCFPFLIYFKEYV